jgi:hypothetical protein
MHPADILWLGLLCTAGTADQEVLRAALDAARARETRLRTVVIAWKETTYVPRGGRLEFDLSGQPLPRDDQTIESSHRLVLDGVRCRLEHDDPGFRRQLPSSGDGVLVFDGERTFHRAYLNGRDRPASLTVSRPESAPDELSLDRLSPLGLWCRAAAPDRLGILAGPAADASCQLTPGPHPEVAIQSKSGATRTYRFDPGRAFVVIRERHVLQTAVTRTEIEYETDPKVGPVPKAWTRTRTRATGKLAESTRAEVTEIRIGVAVQDQTFQLDPLPGETVTDNEARKAYRVRDDGGLDQVDPVSGQVVSLPAERRPLDWPGRHVVRFVVLPGLLLLVLIFVLRRSRRRPHTPSPS